MLKPTPESLVSRLPTPTSLEETSRPCFTKDNKKKQLSDQVQIEIESISHHKIKISNCRKLENKLEIAERKRLEEPEQLQSNARLKHI